MIRHLWDGIADLGHGLLDWLLLSSKKEYGSKKGSGGNTDINVPGRTLRKSK